MGSSKIYDQCWRTKARQFISSNGAMGIVEPERAGGCHSQNVHDASQTPTDDTESDMALSHIVEYRSLDQIDTIGLGGNEGTAPEGMSLISGRLLPECGQEIVVVQPARDLTQLAFRKRARRQRGEETANAVNHRLDLHVTHRRELGRASSRAGGMG